MAFAARVTDRLKPDPRINVSISDDYLHNPNTAVHSILEEIIADCSLYLYDSYLLKKSIPFSVSQLSSCLISTLESFYTRHELTEPDWTFNDIEPEPCGIDTWARSVIPIRLKSKTPQLGSSKLSFDMKSVATSKSRRTLINKKKTGGKAYTEIDSIKESETVPILEKEEEIDENIEYYRKIKEEEHKRKNDEIVKRKTIEEEDLKLDKIIEKESEKLQKQNFTYDYKGNILIINPFQFTEKFGSHPVKYLPEVIVEAENPPEKKLRKIRKLKNEEEEKEWVKNFIKKSGPLIENINLSPNVTYTEGPKIKHGEDRNEHKTLTRNQYFSRKSQISGTSFDRKSSLSSFKSVIKEPSRCLFDILPDYEDGVIPVLPIKVSSKSISPIPGFAKSRVLKQKSFIGLDPLTSTEQFNQDILRNPSWGVNPPYRTPLIVSMVPHKPNIKETLELYGNIVKKPKEVPFITHQELWTQKSDFIKKPKDRPYIDKTIKKKKNPPPGLGKTIFNSP